MMAVIRTPICNHHQDLSFEHTTRSNSVSSVSEVAKRATLRESMRHCGFHERTDHSAKIGVHNCRNRKSVAVLMSRRVKPRANIPSKNTQTPATPNNDTVFFRGLCGLFLHLLASIHRISNTGTLILLKSQVHRSLFPTSNV